MPMCFPPKPRFFLVGLLLWAISHASFGGVAIADSVFEEGNRRVSAELLIDKKTLQPTDSDSVPSANLGIKLGIEPGWHIYWENSGEAGQPTELEFTLPAGWRIGEIRWPTPKKFIERGGIITYGYDSETILTLPLFNPPIDLNKDEAVEIQAKISWLVCKEICVPGEKTLQAKYLFSSEKPLESSGAPAKLLERAAKEYPSELSKRTDIKLSFSQNALQFNSGNFSQVAPNQAQIFPRNSDLINFNEATTIGEALSLPLSRRSVPIPEQSELSGILTVVDKTDGSELALNWKIVLSKDEIESIPTTQGPKAGAVLTHRTVDHSLDEDANPEIENTTPPVSLLFAILAALIAGIVLNLMPCVLPVLSLKLMSLSLQKGLGFKKRLSGTLFYLLGIESAFMTLAIVVGVLRSYGMQLGWGFQFQHPSFVFSLVIVVLIFALGFFDLYFVSVPGISKVDKRVTNTKHPLLKNFFEGILVTLLSTPCTAPFLGTALAFAFTQSIEFTSAIFLAIGFGLALPYILVSLVPFFSRTIPKPGNWMQEIRTVMGFLLLATVGWLISVVESLIPGSGIALVQFSIWIAFLFWLKHPLNSWSWLNQRKWLLNSAVLIGVGVSTFLFYSTFIVKSVPFERVSAGESKSWTAYTPELAERLTSSGHYVFIDFTADWCISCKFNERFILSSDRVQKLFTENNISLLKADWTDGNKMITEALEAYNAHGVPLYVLLAPDGRTEILPTLLTAGIVEEATTDFLNGKGNNGK